MRTHSIPAVATLLPLVFALSVASCSESGPRALPSVAGQWSGTVQNTSNNVALTLHQSGDRITGSGTLITTTETNAVTVSGELTTAAATSTGVAAPTRVTITIADGGSIALHYSAVLEGDEMHGLIDGWSTLTLVRH